MSESRGAARSARSARYARPTRSGGGDAVYGLGLIGAVVYFWQHAHSFGDRVLAVLKALVWPAFLIYDAFRAARGG